MQELSRGEPVEPVHYYAARIYNEPFAYRRSWKKKTDYVFDI
jgi:hypothetical protein